MPKVFLARLPVSVSLARAGSLRLPKGSEVFPFAAREKKPLVTQGTRFKSSQVIIQRVMTILYQAKAT